MEHTEKRETGLSIIEKIRLSDTAIKMTDVMKVFLTKCSHQKTHGKRRTTKQKKTPDEQNRKSLTAVVMFRTYKDSPKQIYIFIYCIFI